jgi:hypothetical protein
VRSETLSPPLPPSHSATTASAEMTLPTDMFQMAWPGSQTRLSNRPRRSKSFGLSPCAGAELQIADVESRSPVPAGGNEQEIGRLPLSMSNADHVKISKGHSHIARRYSVPRLTAPPRYQRYSRPGVRIVNTNFADVQPIRVLLAPVLVVSSSILDDPAKWLRLVLMDRNEFTFLSVTKNASYCRH